MLWLLIFLIILIAVFAIFAYFIAIAAIATIATIGALVAAIYGGTYLVLTAFNALNASQTFALTAIVGTALLGIITYSFRTQLATMKKQTHDDYQRQAWGKLIGDSNNEAINKLKRKKK